VTLQSDDTFSGVLKSAGNGIAFANHNFTFLEYEVPYYSTLPFQLMQDNGVGYNESLTRSIFLDGTTDGRTRFYAAGGDDFTYGYLYAPPEWSDVPQNPQGGGLLRKAESSLHKSKTSDDEFDLIL